MRYEINAALDANDVERLLVVLRHPTCHLGTVDTKMATQYMASLKKFRTENSGTFMDIQWSSITHTLQGKISLKFGSVFLDKHNHFR